MASLVVWGVPPVSGWDGVDATRDRRERYVEGTILPAMDGHRGVGWCFQVLRWSGRSLSLGFEALGLGFQRSCLIRDEACFLDAFDLGDPSVMDGDLHGTEAEIFNIFTNDIHPMGLRAGGGRPFRGCRAHWDLA